MRVQNPQSRWIVGYIIVKPGIHFVLYMLLSHFLCVVFIYMTLLFFLFFVVLVWIVKRSRAASRKRIGTL